MSECFQSHTMIHRKFKRSIRQITLSKTCLSPKRYGVLKIHEVWGERIPSPPYFHFRKGQLEQNLAVYKYVTDCVQIHNKIDNVTTSNNVIFRLFFFLVKVVLTSFSTFRGIKLKFGGAVKSDILILYLLSIL